MPVEIFCYSTLPLFVIEQSRKRGETRKEGMPFSVISSPDPRIDSPNCTAPWWGAWSAFIIVGCFYLTQASGMFMVQVVAGFNVGLSKGGSGLADFDQTWLLPVSLLFGTIGAATVSWQIASHRARPAMEIDWFWEFLGTSHDFSGLWRFVLLGLCLGLSFLALTEYGVLPPDDLPQPLFDAMIAAPLVLKICWILMFVLLFPLIEETLFRGFLFTGFAQSWGPGVAGMLTTLAFVGVHMPKVLEYWPALLAVTLIGALTVFIRIRTGSLVSGMAMHSTYNGTLVAAAFLIQPAS